MSSKKILFNATTTEKRAALLVNDKVIDLVVERPDNYRIAGNTINHPFHHPNIFAFPKIGQ